ncbi:MAG: flagellar basal body rod protein FlgB [Leptospiraceae bacterium]|nr:flagellar basal body rod protein FlgB [Leptospiraceae bacterium]
MFIETHFMKTQDLLERGLNASLFKRRVIADNIANVDTPHFKRSETTFEANLQRALDSEKFMAQSSVPTQITDERHIEFFKPLDYRQVSPKANLDYLSTMRADGNNVDPEKEAVLASHNQMHYSMMVERLNQNFKVLNLVMRSA